MLNYKVNISERSNEDWCIVKKEKVSDYIVKDNRYIPEGTYTILYRTGTGRKVLVMSDTPAEIRDHLSAINLATGRCLIAGLGIGMVLNAIAQKPEVTHIDVVEISQSLIDLVGPHYLEQYGDKLTIHCGDVFEWKPPAQKYDWAWFDIWNTICTDNLPEMHKLHRKYGRKATWKGSWCKEYLNYLKRKQGTHRYRMYS